MRAGRSDGPADRAEAERLLDAAQAGRSPEAGADPLVHLLAAAAGPANPGELSGEEQALAAFRAARAAPAPAPGTAPRRRRLRVAAAAWAAGLAATATAGVAFAAVSLSRPEQPAPPPAPTAVGSTGAGDTGSPAQSPGGSPSGGPAGSPSNDPTRGPGRPATVEQLTGLCRAYLAKPARQRSRALATPAFADLVAAAGGAGQVEAYCARLVPDPGPKASPAPRATRSAAARTASVPPRHTDRPSRAGSARPPAGPPSVIG